MNGAAARIANRPRCGAGARWRGRTASPGWWAVVVLAASLLTGCARGPEALPGGTWRVVLQLPGGELPFSLEVAEAERGATAHPPVYLLNGPDRIRVDEVRVEGNRVTMLMPGFKNRIDATLEGDLMRGTLTMVKAGATEQKIPLAARRGQAWRFTPLSAAAGAPGGNVGGRWAVTFVDQDGKSTAAVGEFRQQDAEVTGTFLTPTGDHRFLAGELRNGTLRLSKFDGGHPFLYEAKLAADGTLSGTYWAGLACRKASPRAATRPPRSARRSRRRR